LFVVALVFWRCFSTNEMLMANDSPLAGFIRNRRLLPEGFIGHWDTSCWLGFPGVIQATPTNFLLYLLPAETFARWVYPLLIGAMALVSFGWFRQMQLSHYAAFFGSLVMTFSGAFFTYILPGHMSKFEMSVLAVLALYCITRAIRTARWSDFAWSGVALGLAVASATDSGALMALLLVAWFFFNVARRWTGAGDRMRRNWTVGFVSLVIISGVTALPTLRGLLASGVSTEMPGAEEPAGSNERLWNWATQWSYPPGEVVDLFTPGYHGWKSHDPKAPYWGALGRAAENYQFASPADLIKKVNNPGVASQLLQFWNFRLNSDFYGSVTLLLIVLAVLAVFAPSNSESFRERGSPSPNAFASGALQHSNAPSGLDWRAQWLGSRRAEIIFWLAVAVVALLTSFGRHFPPLFQLLHSVPPFNSMRNPNKLLVILTPALAALAALGADRLWREAKPQGETK
jgi:hypothetical protein